ncbi:MAG: DUF945 family protein [Oligoflexia bacterium]|nr:DUF945 family protein [Oligoflexia bacterium]
MNDSNSKQDVKEVKGDDSPVGGNDDKRCWCGKCCSFLHGLSKKQKLIVFVVLLLVLALLLLMPWLIGIVCFNKFNQVTELLQQEFKDKIEVVSKYERGYLSSKAEMELRILGKEINPLITIKSKIRHWSARAKTEVTFDRYFQILYLGEDTISPNINIDSSFCLFGGVSSKITSDLVQLSVGGASIVSKTHT